MTREQWVQAFAERIGLEPPAAEEIDVVLALARISAHGSEKTTAPVSCWLAGRSGRPLDELLRIGRDINEQP